MAISFGFNIVVPHQAVKIGAFKAAFFGRQGYISTVFGQDPADIFDMKMVDDIFFGLFERRLENILLNFEGKRRLLIFWKQISYLEDIGSA